MDKKLVAKTIKDLVVKHETANQIGFSAAIVWKPCDLLPQTFSLGVSDEIDLSPEALAAAAIFYSELMHIGVELDQNIIIKDFWYFKDGAHLVLSADITLFCKESEGVDMTSFFNKILSDNEEVQEIRKNYDLRVSYTIFEPVPTERVYERIRKEYLQ